MTTRLSRLFPALALAAFVAVMTASCAPNALSTPPPGTDLSNPTGGIDYHGGRYRMLNG